MALEMETAAIFIVPMIRGVRAGAIMAYGEDEQSHYRTFL